MRRKDQLLGCYRREQDRGIFMMMSMCMRAALARRCTDILGIKYSRVNPVVRAEGGGGGRVEIEFVMREACGGTHVEAFMRQGRANG